MSEDEAQIRKSQWSHAWDHFQRAVHDNSQLKGFWKPHLDDYLHKLMLVVSELGEAAEAWREGNPPSDKAEGFSQCEEEMADAIIRLMDMAGHYGFDLGAAILRKVEYNVSRPYLHGKKA